MWAASSAYCLVSFHPKQNSIIRCGWWWFTGYLLPQKIIPPYSLADAPSTFVYFRGEASQFTPRHCLPSPHYFSTTLVGLHPFPLPEGSRSREGSTAYKIICFSVLYKGVGVCWLAVPLITSASFQCCCKLLGQIPLAGVGFLHLAKNGFNLPFSAILVSLT